MSLISEMIIKIGADSSDLKKGMTDAKKTINQAFDTSPVNAMTNAISGTTTSMSGLIGAVSKYAGLMAGGFGLAAMIDSTTKAGTATVTLSKQLGISAAELGLLKRTLALTGGDVETASKTIMKLDKTLTAAGDSGDKVRGVLDAFGATLTDGNGKLLPINKQLEQLAKGYNNALKAGMGQEFLMNTLGAKGLALADTLVRYNEAAKKATEVKSVGLKAEELAELDMQIKVLQLQASQMGTAFTQALLPVAQTLLPALMPPLQEAATFLKENREELATLTTTVIGFAAAYKTLSLAAAAYATVQKFLATQTVTAEAAAQVELTALQQKSIAQREKAIYNAAMREIAANEKTVRAMAVSEAEKTRIQSEFSAKRIIRAEEEAAAFKATMTKSLLEYNVAQAEKVVAEETAGNAAVKAGQKKVAAETAAKGATVSTTEAVLVQSGAYAASGAAAETAGVKSLLMMGKTGTAVKQLTGLLFTMAGGWMTVAAAIAYAGYQFVTWQLELAKERDANTFSTNDGQKYVYRDGRWFTTGYNPTGKALADQGLIDQLNGKRVYAQVEAENAAKSKQREEAAKAEAEQKKITDQMAALAAGIADNTSATTASTKATESLTSYSISHPIGLDVAEKATNAYKEGEPWMGTVTGNPNIQCDSWTGDVYAKAGISSIGGVSTAGAISGSAFLAAGAYHGAGSGYKPQPGDLVDFNKHVGIYLGNGKVRTRQSQGGVHTATLAEAEGMFGSVLGYGSVAEATNGRTSTAKLQGTSAEAEAARKAEEAVKKAEQAQRDAVQLLTNIRQSITDLSATEYERSLGHLEVEYEQRKKQINQYAMDGADKETITALRQAADLYYEASAGEALRKQQTALRDFAGATKKIYAENINDYQAMAEAEYQIAVAKAQKELEVNQKALAQGADDYEALEQVRQKYYADVQAAEKALQKSKKKAHQDYISYLKDEGDLATLIADIQKNSVAWAEDMKVQGYKDMAEQFVKWAEETHKTWVNYATDISSSLYDSMSSGLAEFIQGTKTAAEVFQDFGNTILTTMAKIAAQRLAAQWVGSIFGGVFKSVGAGGSLGYADLLFNADGGYISGPGTSRSDSIPAMLSNGEYVVNASSTKKFRGLLEAINGYANGGYVTSTPSMNTVSGGAISFVGDSSAGGSGGVVVNITNNSDSNVTVENQSYDAGLDQWVLDVVVDGAYRNRGGFGRNLKTALGGAM